MKFGKDVDTLGLTDTLTELDWMLDTYKKCQEIGQGISTKEAVYYRQLKARLAVLDIDKANQFLDEEARTLGY